MHYSERPPALALRDVVRCYWFLSAEPPEQPSRAEPAFPDGSPELIFSLADPFIACPEGGDERRQPDVFLVGQITKPFAVRPSGRADLVGVRLEAHAATWMGLNLPELVDREVDVAAACNAALSSLRVLLINAPDEDARVRHLDAALSTLILGAAQADWRVAAAVASVRRQRGLTDLAALAAEIGTTPRSLQRLFNRDVGISPKLLARIVRFQQVFAAWREDPASLSRVAQDCGYFDHAHLVRDFRELAGVPPAALLPNMPTFTRLFTQG
jgi:AraC-like DNA-binding protein